VTRLISSKVIPHLSFGILALIYYILSIIIVKIWPDPIIMIFVTCVSLLLVPLIIGKAVVSIFYKNHGNDYSTFISSNMIEWITGIVIIYFLAATLFTFDILTPNVFTFGIILFPLIYLIYLEQKNSHVIGFIRPSFSKLIQVAFGNKLIIPIILIAGVLPLLYLAPVLPFPLSTTGTYSRIRLSLQFIDSGNSLLSPIQSLSAIIYNIHPLQVLSSTNYLQHILFSFSLYLVSYKMTKDSIISLFPAFIGPWFFLGGNAGLTAMENTPLIFLIFPWILYAGLDRFIKFPISSMKFSKSTFLLVFPIIFLSPITYLVGKGGSVIPPAYFVFLSIFLPIILMGIFYIINFRNRRRIGFLVTFVVPFMLIAILHPYIGTLAVFFLTCFFFAFSVDSARMLKILRIASVIFTAISLLLIVLGINGSSNFILSKFFFPNSIISGTASDLTVQQKWSTFLEFGPAIFVYIFLGLTFLISIFGNKKYIPFVFASSIMLLLTFSPESNFWRSEMFLNPLAAIIIAYAFVVLWKLINGDFQRFYNKVSLNIVEGLRSKLDRLKKRWTLPRFQKIFFIFLILVVLLPIAMASRNQYFYNVDFKVAGEGYFSYAQTYDVNCSFWILDNFENEKVLIISDPGTMYFVGSLTAKDTLMVYSDPFPWSVYLNETWDYMDKLKSDVFLLLGENGSYGRIQNAVLSMYPQTQNKIYSQLQDYDKVLLVITPHTYYWLYENNIFPTRVKILPINDVPVLDALNNDTDFNLVHQEANFLYVYELQK
jgi:hypothetical protein